MSDGGWEGPRERWQKLVAPVLDGHCKGLGGMCIDCGAPTGAANRERGGAVRLRCGWCSALARRKRDRERRHEKKEAPDTEVPGAIDVSQSDC